MPSFSFDLKIVGHKKKPATIGRKGFDFNNRKTTIDKVVESGCEGTVVIREDGTYRVKYKDKLYSICQECYDTKGKKVIYAKFLDKYNHRIKIIRDIGFRTKWSNDHYLPFAPGLVVKGKLILSSNHIILFYIVSVYNLGSVQEVKDAYKEWQEYLINIREMKENAD